MLKFHPNCIYSKLNRDNQKILSEKDHRPQTVPDLPCEPLAYHA